MTRKIIFMFLEYLQREPKPNKYLKHGKFQNRRDCLKVWIWVFTHVKNSPKHWEHPNDCIKKQSEFLWIFGNKQIRPDHEATPKKKNSTRQLTARLQLLDAKTGSNGLEFAGQS